MLEMPSGKEFATSFENFTTHNSSTSCPKPDDGHETPYFAESATSAVFKTTMKSALTTNQTPDTGTAKQQCMI